jgi:hypothetical protein
MKTYAATGPISSMPNVQQLPLVGQAFVDTINFKPAPDAGAFGTAIPGTPDNYFATTFQGQFQVKTAGTYSFCISSEDGSDLTIDGTVTVNNQGLHATTQVCSSIQLTAGSHKAFVNFFQNQGGTSCVVTWSGPDTGGTTQILRSNGNPLDVGTSFVGPFCTVTWPSSFVASTKDLARCQALVNTYCISACGDNGLATKRLVSLIPALPNDTNNSSPAHFIQLQLCSSHPFKLSFA